MLLHQFCWSAICQVEWSHRLTSPPHHVVLLLWLPMQLCDFMWRHCFDLRTWCTRHCLKCGIPPPSLPPLSISWSGHRSQCLWWLRELSFVCRPNPRPCLLHITRDPCQALFCASVGGKCPFPHRCFLPLLPSDVDACALHRCSKDLLCKKWMLPSNVLLLRRSKMIPSCPIVLLL